MSAHEKLKKYRSKRDFTKTREPEGTDTKKNTEEPVFVIQKHDATALHYDLRLEIDGVLKSWAVPKGPSLDPRVKRLAIETEDHPMEYGSFEGVIPEGHYGAGAVIIWDNGTYKNILAGKGKPLNMEEAYNKGQIEVELNGKKLKGAFVLFRLGDKKSKNWLLKKMKDEYADARRNPLSSQQESVVSGLTIQEMARLKQTGRS